MDIKFTTLRTIALLTGEGLSNIEVGEIWDGDWDQYDSCPIASSAGLQSTPEILASAGALDGCLEFGIKADFSSKILTKHMSLPMGFSWALHFKQSCVCLVWERRMSFTIKQTRGFSWRLL